MELRPELIIATVIKSLSDNVLPAVDPENAPAVQQTQLSIALLEILKSRLSIMYRYDRHDLQSFVSLAEELVSEDGSGSSSRDLVALCAAARSLLDRARAEPAELLEKARQVRLAIGNYVDEVRLAANPERTRKVDRMIVESARELTLRERSWMLPFGFEADPALIPELESLLAPIPN